MNKKIILLTIGLFIISLLLIPIFVVCLDGTYQDPKNDVIYVKEYNLDIDLENFDYTDFEDIKDIDYEYTSNRPQIDIDKVIINEVGENTNFVIEVEKVQLIYPSTGSNGFILAVVIVDNDDIFVAASLKYALLSINKYGYVSEVFKENVSEDDFKNFELSISGGKLSFNIPTSDLPNSINEIYIVLGEATISEVNLQELTFKIDDLYGDIYPNSLYGGTTDIPIDENGNGDVDSNRTSEEEEGVNPFTIGLYMMIGIIVLISVPAVIIGRKR